MTIDTEFLLKELAIYFAGLEMNAKLSKLIQRPIDVGAVLDLMDEVIYAVERFVRDAHEVGKGKEKRAAVVKFLDEAIKLGWIGEKIDGWIIGLAVDYTVKLLNAKSKQWIKLRETP